MGKYENFEIVEPDKKPIAIVYICKGCGNRVGCRIEAVMIYCSTCRDKKCPNAKGHIMREEPGVTFSCCIRIEKKHDIIKG